MIEHDYQVHESGYAFDLLDVSLHEDIYDTRHRPKYEYHGSDSPGFLHPMTDSEAVEMLVEATPRGIILDWDDSDLIGMPGKPRDAPKPKPYIACSEKSIRIIESMTSGFPRHLFKPLDEPPELPNTFLGVNIKYDNRLKTGEWILVDPKHLDRCTQEAISEALKERGADLTLAV